MLTRKVIATDITNLTDARYFAARGVDFLMFSFDQLSIQDIVEIVEWVEGPKVLILFKEDSLRLLDEAVLKIKPHGVGSRSTKAVGEMEFLSSHVEVFLWQGETLTIGPDTYVQIGQSSSLKSLESDVGILLAGGNEEQVGVKSFEDMDEILDALED